MNLKLKTLAAAVIPALGIGIAGAGMDLASQSHELIGAQFHQDGQPAGTIQAITFDPGSAQATLTVADATGTRRDVALKGDTPVVGENPAPAVVATPTVPAEASAVTTTTGLGAPAEITLRPDSRMNKLIGARVSDEQGRSLGKVTSVSVAETMTGSQVFARVEQGAGIDAQIVALGQPDMVAALVNTPVREADMPVDVVFNRSNRDADILTPQSKGE